MGVRRFFHRADFKTESSSCRPRASGDLFGGWESGIVRGFSEVPACARTTVRDGAGPNNVHEKDRP